MRKRTDPIRIDGRADEIVGESGTATGKGCLASVATLTASLIVGIFAGWTALGW